MSRLLALPLIAIARLWQWTFSGVMAPSCRFQPSCSEYAVQALHKHGVARGGWLALRRVLRCHPWGGAGFDPVPD